MFCDFKYVIFLLVVILSGDLSNQLLLRLGSQGMIINQESQEDLVGNRFFLNYDPK